MSKAAGRCPRTRERRCFNLIELILGLGVLAFGVASIVALLSRSLSTNRTSIGETYAATHGDQFLHFYSMRMRGGDSDDWEEWGTSLPERKPGSDEAVSRWSSWYDDDSVTYARSGSSAGLHRVSQRSPQGETEFDAVCRLWRSRVTLYNYASGTWRKTDLPYDEAMILNIEISWPASVPYRRRRKSLFQLEVYQNQ